MLADIDSGILQTLYRARGDGLTAIFLFMSAIGETEVMLLVTALVAALLFFWLEQRLVGIGLLTTMIVSTVITFALKHVVARARPDLLYQAYVETGFSFPSGHASAAAAFGGFFAYIAWKKMSPGPRRAAVVALAAIYVFVMAFGRIYLGVHYFSDVMAGLAIGVCAAFAGAIVFDTFMNRAASRGAPSAQ
ncbi:MAG TPA: phosphatase PAP2 family protein [Candidatus Paceibacterota bacterium]